MIKKEIKHDVVEEVKPKAKRASKTNIVRKFKISLATPSSFFILSYYKGKFFNIIQQFKLKKL